MVQFSTSFNSIHVPSISDYTIKSCCIAALQANLRRVNNAYANTNLRATVDLNIRKISTMPNSISFHRNSLFYHSAILV